MTRQPYRFGLGRFTFEDVDRRLSLAFGALVMGLMVLVLLVGGFYLKGIMEREEDKLSTLLTQVLAKAVSRVSFSGKYHARLFLEEIRAEQPRIRYLRIVDPAGNILAHSDPTLDNQRLAPEEMRVVNQVLTRTARQVRQVTWRGEGLLEVSLPYRGGYDDATLGVIQAGLSRQDRDAALWRGLIYMALMVLGLLAVSVAAVRRISARFGAPVKRLADDMAATLMAIPDLLFELDQEGRYIQVLAHREELLADFRERLLGHTIHEVLSPEAAASMQTALEEARAKGESHGCQLALSLAEGARWFELSVARKPGAPEGGPHFIVLSRDITERHQAQAQMLLADSVFENAREGILITDADQRILRVNPAFRALTGYTEAELLGQRPAMFRSGHHDAALYEHMAARLAEQGHWQGEVWDRRKDGQVIPLLLSISATRGHGGMLLNYVAVFTDISRIKQSEERLEYLAHHDPLTGLSNRLMLHMRLEHVLDRARREGKSIALLLLDLDRFKDVNDSFGHAMGDALLKEVARRLSRRVRQADTVSRLGGDEFTILMEELSHPEDAARLAETLVALLRDPIRLPNGKEVVVGASVGIALFPEHADSEESLLQQADTALYQAKAEGRGRYKYFSDALTRAALERIEMEGRLRAALDKGELRLHYQPQVDIASGSIVGAEVLVRWQDPVCGMIPPNRFIPLAEHTGLIHGVGAWVLREACIQGRRWLDMGLPPLTLAVNISPHQFRHGNLAEQVMGILAQTRFPPRYLELELTESALMDQQEQALATLNALRAQGIRLAIDDFGTGYSSLSYIKRFSLDLLKIDKSFVEDIPHSQDDQEIAATIIAMAHTLRLKVLAEGVETTEQLAFLRAKGCDLYQGYLKSRPLAAEAFQALLQAGATYGLPAQQADAPAVEVDKAERLQGF